MKSVHCLKHKAADSYSYFYAEKKYYTMASIMNNYHSIKSIIK